MKLFVFHNRFMEETAGLRVSFKEKGYIALTSILIISAITFAIAMTVSIIGIQNAQTALSVKKGDETLIIANSCIEDALSQLKSNPLFTGETLNVGNNSCTITVTGADTNLTLLAVATLSEIPSYTKRIQATATLFGNSISLTSWHEIAQ